MNGLKGKVSFAEALAIAPFVELPLMKGGGAGCQVIAVIPEVSACSSPSRASVHSRMDRWHIPESAGAASVWEVVA